MPVKVSPSTVTVFLIVSGDGAGLHADKVTQAPAMNHPRNLKLCNGIRILLDTSRDFYKELVMVTGQFVTFYILGGIAKPDFMYMFDVADQDSVLHERLKLA